MLWAKLLFVLLPLTNVKAADYIGTNRKWDTSSTPIRRIPRPVPKPIEMEPVQEVAIENSSAPPTTQSGYMWQSNAARVSLSKPEVSTTQAKWVSEPATTAPPQIILLKESEPEIPTSILTSPSPVSPSSYLEQPNPEEIKVINISHNPSTPLDLSSILPATASPNPTVIVLLVNGNSESPASNTDADSNTKVIVVTTPQTPSRPIDISPADINLPARKKPVPAEEIVSPAPTEPVTLITPRPLPSWETTTNPKLVQTAPPLPPPTTEPPLIWRKEPVVESRPIPTAVTTTTPRVTKVVLPREYARAKPVVKEPIIVPATRKPILAPNRMGPEPDYSKMVIPVVEEPEKTTKEPTIIVQPKPAPAPVEPVVVYQPAPTIPPASNLVVNRPKPQPTPAPAKPEPTYVEQRPVPKPTSSPIVVSKPPYIQSRNPLPASPTVASPQLFDYNCKDFNGYYGVSNDCDSYVECKKRAAMMKTCPEGLHFNPKAVWPEYPCGYPWEVQCDGSAARQQPKPTSECPHQYGYFSLAGDCGKYVMCQEGLATIMDCPPGLAFNDAINSCDWPENVPTCNPDVFKGFTCPTAPADEYGILLDVIFKYRYGQSCREYVACQHGRPRLLSCDPGLSFDEDSQVCIDSDYVQNCSMS